MKSLTIRKASERKLHSMHNRFCYNMKDEITIVCCFDKFLLSSPVSVTAGRRIHLPFKQVEHFAVVRIYDSLKSSSYPYCQREGGQK